MQLDLFAAASPFCGSCPNFGDPIPTGAGYCHALMTFVLGSEKRECVARERRVPRWKPANITRTDAIRDLLESPRHNISPKDRKWLEAELRSEGASA